MDSNTGSEVMMNMPLSIFRRMEVFDESHIPDEFLFRESEMIELASCVAPLKHQVQGTHAVLYGPPATGKTTSIKKLFEQIEVSGSRIALVHINALVRRSAWAVLSEMVRVVCRQKALPDKSTPTVKMVDHVLKNLAKHEIPMVLCIDEFTCMGPKDLEAVVMPFARPWEFGPYDDVRVSVFLAGTSFDPSKHRGTLLSTLGPVRVKYAPYTEDQFYGILESRARAGFGPGVATEEALRMIASSGLDMRQSIRTLMTAGQIADWNGSGRVTTAEVRQSLQRLGIRYAGLSDGEITLLREIETRGEMPSGDIYRFSKETLGLGQTRTYQLIERLLDKGAIKAEYHHIGGRSRIFRCVEGV
jgi:cell division control protein 6